MQRTNCGRVSSSVFIRLASCLLKRDAIVLAFIVVEPRFSVPARG